jgi:hypothetical protein
MSGIAFIIATAAVWLWLMVKLCRDYPDLRKRGQKRDHKDDDRGD